MICIIALIVFGILGIFSAKYRVIAKESFNCVFKKMTLRKCDTGLDVRLKSQITGSMMRWWPAAGRTLYKYFEIFSWTFLIITLATLFFTGQGIYNYAAYGNCNGKNSDQFCIFDPLGNNKPVNTTEGSTCSIPGHNQSILTTPPLGYLIDGTYQGNKNAKVVIIEFGCYSCHYTKIEEAVVKKIIQKYDGQILFVYKDFPLSITHINAQRAAEAAHCALDQGKYWDYRDYLFANQQNQFEEDLVTYAQDLSLNITQFQNCLDTEKYKPLVEQNYQEGISSGISVTPTFFINNKTIVGAKDYSEFKKVINQELGIQWWQFWR